MQITSIEAPRFFCGEFSEKIRINRTSENACDPLYTVILFDEDIEMHISLDVDEACKLRDLFAAYVSAKKISREIDTFTLKAADAVTLTINYDNRGEPFREGLSISARKGNKTFDGFFETGIIRELSKLLDSFDFTRPEPTPAVMQAHIWTPAYASCEKSERRTVVNTGLLVDAFAARGKREEMRQTLKECFAVLWGDCSVRVVFDDEQSSDGDQQ